MALISDYLENKLAETILREEKVWVALLYQDPTDTSKVVELTGRGYRREYVKFDSPVDGLVSNAEKIIFHKATSIWKEVTHLSLMDAEFGGHTLFHGAVSTPVAIPKNKNFFIKIGKLQAGFE